MLHFDLALVVSEHHLAAVPRNVNCEAALRQMRVLMHNLASVLQTKRLARCAFIAAAGHHDALAVHDARRIDRGLNDLRVGVPLALDRGLFEVTDVPNLQALATGTTASDQGFTVLVHIERVAAHLHSANVVGHLAVAQVPQFDVAVPAARIQLIRVERRETR